MAYVLKERSVASKSLVTNGVLSMFAGELIFIHPNLESHAVPFWLAMGLWLAFGISAALWGDHAYNRWQLSSDTVWSRFLKLIAVEIAIVVAAIVFFRVVFFLAGLV